MITSIEIKNLRGIAEGKLEGLSPLTILVGPNGSGKSTVLDGFLIGAHPVLPNGLSEVIGRRSGVRQGARWIVWRAEEGRTVLVMLFGERATIEWQTKLRLETTRPGEPTQFEFGVGRGSAGPLGKLTVGEGGTLKCDTALQRRKLVPDLRLVAAYGPKPERLDALYTQCVERGRREQVTSVLRELIPGLKHIEILTENGKPIVHLVFDDHSIPVALAGDGIHSLLRLSLELAALPGGLALLEEPEVHQHPASIRQTARAIWAAVRRDVQVVLSTHSLELIDTLLAEAKDDDLDRLSLFRVKLDQGRLISVRLAGKEVERARTQIEDDLR